jgi:hypothetical protein
MRRREFIALIGGRVDMASRRPLLRKERTALAQHEPFR